MWCVKIGQQTFPGLSKTRTPVSSHKGPLSIQMTLWLHCNQQPALNKTSRWMGAIFTTRTSSQNEGHAGCRDTSTGVFQHPLHWGHWAQQAEKKSDIYCQRLPHKELKRDGGGGGLKDKGSLFADGDEWVDHNALWRRPLHPQRGLLKWHDWQLNSLTPPAPTLRLKISLGSHVRIIAHRIIQK